MKKKIKKIVKKRQKGLTTKRVDVKVPSMRKIIRGQMKAMGMTAYRLSVKSGVSRQSISYFLKGGDTRSAILEKLLDALELMITPSRPNSDPKPDPI